eukprot:1158895-Pelagomonas_calceolata.AAC.1
MRVTAFEGVRGRLKASHSQRLLSQLTISPLVEGCTTDIWAPGSRTASFGSRQELVAAKYKIEEAQAFGTRMLGGMLAGKSTSEFKFGFKHCQGGLLRSVNWAAVLLWASISPCQFPHVCGVAF